MPPSETLDLSGAPFAASQLTAEQNERLTDILDRYLLSLESGVPLQHDKLIEEHPDLADHLRGYLGSLDDLHCAAAGFGNSSASNSTAHSQRDDESKQLGDFVLGCEIGRGGMGVVYDARQISLDRRVALKVLPFAAVLDAKQIARFKTEAQAAAQILHPNIVPVFAIGVDRGVHFYAMQFIDGQPLDRAIVELRKCRQGERSSCAIRCHEEEVRVDGGNVLSRDVPSNSQTIHDGPTRKSLLTSHPDNSREYFQTIARLGVQAAEALHAAHEYGIVHRDIKPSNLLLDYDGKLWVTDFGLARCHRDATYSKTGEVVGTVRYMSPEQASGQTSLIDQRTDVYSLGVTLYEVLALEPAVPGDDSPELLRTIAEQTPPPLRKLQPKIPADLENVILKAIAKTREDRYTTARAFANDLRRFLEGKPTVAKPTSHAYLPKENAPSPFASGTRTSEQDGHRA